MGANEVIVLITGDQARLTTPELMVKQMEAKAVPVFLVSYPPTLHTSFLPLAKHGGVYSVVENSENTQPLIHLQVRSVIFINPSPRSVVTNQSSLVLKDLFPMK